jgi:hypothetical protein
VRVSVPLADPAHRDDVLRRLQTLVVLVNQIAAQSGRSPMMISADQSGPRDGHEVLTLLPCHPEGALENCKRVAHILWGAMPDTAPNAVQVLSPTQETPVFEIAA